MQFSKIKIIEVERGFRTLHFRASLITPELLLFISSYLGTVAGEMLKAGVNIASHWCIFTIILFVCPSRTLHKHCLQFLLGPL